MTVGSASTTILNLSLISESVSNGAKTIHAHRGIVCSTNTWFRDNLKEVGNAKWSVLNISNVCLATAQHLGTAHGLG